MNQSIDLLKKSLFVLLIVIVIRALLVFGSELAGSKAAICIKRELRERVLSHIIELGPANITQERTGELVTIMMAGVESLDEYFSKYLPQLTFSALIPITILIVIFPLDQISGIVLIITAPLIPFFMFLIGKNAGKETKKQWKLLGKLSAQFLDIIQGLVTLKALGRSKEQIYKIGSISEEYADITMGVLKLAFLSSLALELLSMLSIAVVAVEIGIRLLYGQILFQNAMFILILAPEYYLPLRKLGLYFHSGMEGVSAAERINSILEMPLPKKRKQNYSNRYSPTIEFHNVSFIYTNRKHQVISDINIIFYPNTTVALVGPSGAGKSTIAKLLMGFLQPSKGEILVNGMNLGEISSLEWKNQIAWISQNPFLFRGSIIDNLRFANSLSTDEDIERGVDQAGLKGWIDTLPNGYNTNIGERGFRISGGQAQRLALARAFIKNAQILVLDEPTSQLDLKTELYLQEEMKKHFVERNVLVIAHRLNTIVDADKIVVLKEGRIVGEGIHMQLLENNPFYSSLFIKKGEN